MILIVQYLKKEKKDNEEEQKENVDDQYENDYINFNDFITPYHYIGIENDNVILR